MMPEEGIQLVVAASKIASSGDQTRDLMRQAIAAATRGDVQCALSAAKQLDQRNPRHSEAAVLQGSLLLHDESQRGPAMVSFRRAMSQDPGNALPLWYLAVDELRNGRPAQALAILEEAAKCEPPDSYAIVTLAWLLEMIGRDVDSASLIQNKLLAPGAALACATLGGLLRDDASALPQQVGAAKPIQHAWCLYDLARLCNGPIDPAVNAKAKNIDHNIGANQARPRRCPHLTNVAADSYKWRYGDRVLNHYFEAFCEEILSLKIGAPLRQNPFASLARPANGQATDGMVRVPQGEYTVGCDEQSVGYPEKRCTLRAFLIDQYPVTNNQWRGFQPNHVFPKGHENHPVVNVDFIQAALYARSKGKRLPTETEWEAAARGTQGQRYPWGNAPDVNRALCAERKAQHTLPVTQHPLGAASCGAQDMMGNAQEWVDTWATTSGTKQRVAKGAGYGRGAALLVCWFRSLFAPTTKHPTIGFRCVRDL